MRLTSLICASAAISMLAACSPKLSQADEEDATCFLANLSAFSNAKKMDPGVQSPITRALGQSALYRMGRLQGRHGDDDWPEVINKLDPAWMKVRVADKVQACGQSSEFGSIGTNSKLKAALQKMADAEAAGLGQ